MKIYLLYILPAVIISMTPASAASVLVYANEFSSAGVLPSADTDVSLNNTTGLPESSVFSVAGGFLSQSTFSANGNATYTHEVVGGALDPAIPTVVEVRLDIDSINGMSGARFALHDGGFRYGVFFESGGVRLGTASSTLIPVNVFSPHNYRLETAGDGSGQYTFYLDDVLTDTVGGTSSTLNRFSWGDGITASGSGADASWDYVRVTQIPEPSVVTALLCALGSFILRRRRV